VNDLQQQQQQHRQQYTCSMVIRAAVYGAGTPGLLPLSRAAAIIHLLQLSQRDASNVTTDQSITHPELPLDFNARVHLCASVHTGAAARPPKTDKVQIQVQGGS
jgi:hypothetical protein